MKMTVHMFKKKVHEYNTCSAVMHYPECLQRFEKYDRKKHFMRGEIARKKNPEMNPIHSFRIVS